MKKTEQFTFNHGGFTLVEMMVALAVGLLVLAGIGQIFIKTKQAAVLQEELARLQENSRYAIQILNTELRNAGYLGCRHAANIQTAYLDTGGTFSDNLAIGIEGYEATGTAPGAPFSLDSPIPGWQGGNGTVPDVASTPLGGQPLAPGSDIVVVRYASGPGLTLSQDKQNDDRVMVNNVSVERCSNGSSGYSGLCSTGNELALISDCERARVFPIGDLSLNGGILSITDATGASWVGEHNSTLPFTVAESALFEARSVAFFVRPNTAGVPSLYRMVGNGQAQELVEGVENLQIVYGEDPDGDRVPNQYLTADRVSDFSQVVSVQIALLMRTVRESAGRAAIARTVNLLSTPVQVPADRYYRRAFTTTIQLRNPAG